MLRIGLLVDVWFDLPIDALSESGPGPWSIRLENWIYYPLSRTKISAYRLRLILDPDSAEPDAGANILFYNPPPGEPKTLGVPLVGPAEWPVPYP